MLYLTYGVLAGVGIGIAYNVVIATVSNKVLEVTGGYTATFVMLLLLTFAALIMNAFIRKP